MRIREIIYRLLDKFFLLVTGSMSTEAYGNLILFSGLGNGIDGAVHTTLSKYSKSGYPMASDQALLSVGASREKGFRGFGKG